MNSLMNFGKYKNKTIEWVLENDIEYLDWAVKNVIWFSEKCDSTMKKKDILFISEKLKTLTRSNDVHIDSSWQDNGVDAPIILNAMSI